MFVPHTEVALSLNQHTESEGENEEVERGRRALEGARSPGSWVRAGQRASGLHGAPGFRPGVSPPSRASLTAPFQYPVGEASLSLLEASSQSQIPGDVRSLSFPRSRDATASSAEPGSWACLACSHCRPSTPPDVAGRRGRLAPGRGAGEGLGAPAGGGVSPEKPPLQTPWSPLSLR